MTAESPLSLRVNTISYGARGINIFEFVREDGQLLPAAEAGAHIRLRLPNGLTRHYSILRSGENLRSYQIGVKREENGGGGSRYMHDQMKVGDIVDIESPHNYFQLADTSAYSVLIGGGIGITPIYCMLNTLRRQHCNFELHYACRTRAEALFANELAASKQCHLHIDDEYDGKLLDIRAIIRQAPEGAHYYCCGPAPMLNAFKSAMSAIDESRVHFEYFTSAQEVATQGGFVVYLARSGTELVVPSGQSILQVLLDAGVDVQYSCEQGICGTCEVTVLDGTPDHRDMILTEAEKAEGKTMMVCCSGSKSDRLVFDL